MLFVMVFTIPKVLHSCEKSLANRRPLNGNWNSSVTLRLRESQVALASSILLIFNGTGYLKLGGKAQITSVVAKMMRSRCDVRRFGDALSITENRIEISINLESS